jgi:hypothetical protein
MARDNLIKVYRGAIGSAATPEDGEPFFDLTTHKLYCGASGTWCEIGSAGGSGDVVGPSSATDNALARFDSTTGKLLQNSTVVVSDAGNVVSTLTNGSGSAVDDALTIDVDSSGTPGGGFGARQRWTLKSSTTVSQDAALMSVTWATATHASRKARVVHTVYDAAGSRVYLIGEASGSAAMIGFLGASASAQLASPDLATLATTFGLASGSPTLAEIKLTFTDVTTNDASTSAHGFLKKLDNDPTHFMNGQGNWSAPSAGGRTEGTLAATGSTQGDAAAITTDAAEVSGADGTKGVILPGTAGAIVVVRNTGGSTLKVYPNSGAAISGGGTNAAASLFSGTATMYVRTSSTKWYTVSMI